MPAEIDTKGWWDYIGSIAPQDRETRAFEIPDTAYDSIRERYFNEVVRPQIASQGINPEAMRGKWNEATTRPGKSSHPLLEATGKAALHGLTAPIPGDMGKAAEKLSEAAQKELGRQGFGAITQGATQLVGEGLGMAPYFAGPVAGARAVGAKIAGKLGAEAAAKEASIAAAGAAELGPEAAMEAGKQAWASLIGGIAKKTVPAVEIPTVGAVQGLYDAAKADDGHRVSEGLTGFALGAGFAAGIEGVVGLRGLLKAKHKLSKDEADAVLATAKGTATEAQEARANRLINQQPEIGTSLEEWLTKSVQKAKATAQPREPISVEKGSKITIGMMGADGGFYNLKPLDPANIDQVIKRIDAHLQKGGEIYNVSGDPAAVNKLYLQFDQFAKARGEYELPVRLKGQDAEAGPLVLWKPQEKPTRPVDVQPEAPAPVASVEPPKPEMPTTDRFGNELPKGAGSTYDMLQNLSNAHPDWDEATLRGMVGHRKDFDEAYAALSKLRPSSPTGVEPPSLTTSEPGLSSPKAPPAGVSDLNPTFGLVSLPDGRVVDKASKTVWNNLEDALKSKGIKSERPRGKADFDSGDWYTPEGNRLRVEEGDDHANVVIPILRSKGIKANPMQPDDAIENALMAGLVRTRKDGVEAYADYINKPQVYQAVGDMLEEGRKEVWLTLRPGETSTLMGAVRITKDTWPEFLDNPAKYFRQAKKMRFEMSRRDALKGIGGGAANFSSGKIKALTTAAQSGEEGKGGMMMRFQRRSGSLDESISAKNSVYHATDLEGFRGVIKEGKVNFTTVESNSKDLKDAIKKILSPEEYDDFLFGGKKHGPEWVANVYKRAEAELNNGGVSVSRTPRIASKADKAITFVIDPEKAPKMRPFVEEGYGKTWEKVGDNLTEVEEKAFNLYEERLATLGPDHPATKAAKAEVEFTKSTLEEPNQHFEFENRTFNEPIGLESVKGVLVDKSALREAGRAPDLKTVLAWAKENKPGIASAYMRPTGTSTSEALAKKNIERTMVDLYNDAHMSTSVDNEVARIVAEAKSKGLEVKIFENGKEMHAYRASMSKQDLKWEKGGLRSTEPRELLPGPDKDTPLATRGVSELPFNNLAITQPMGKGQKPLIIYDTKQEFLRSTSFHENLHGHFAYLGLEDAVMGLNQEKFAKAGLYSAFDDVTREAAGPYMNEEVINYLLSAVRTNDATWLKRFVDADESLPNVLNIADDTASKVKMLALMEPDSLHQRVLTRKMADVQRRAGGMLALREDLESLGHRLALSKQGDFVVKTSDGKRLVFNDRQKLVDFIEKEYVEPTNAPNLIDETHIPAGIPKYAMRRKPGAPPLTTDPPISGPKGGSVKGGAQALSFYFRPFYAWLETVSQNNEWPELYSAFKKIDDLVPQMDRTVMKHEQVLHDLLKDVKREKYNDLYEYLSTPSANQARVARQLNLTPGEVALAAKMRSDYYEPLLNELGIDASKYLEDWAPLRRDNPDIDPRTVKPVGRLTQQDIDTFARYERTGELDPNDTDLLRVSHAFTKVGARDRFLGSALSDAEHYVNLKDEKGGYVLGTLRPLLKRHLEYLKGNPDGTQRVVDGAVDSLIKTLNETIDQVNSKLPDKLKMGKIEMDAREALGRFVLFSYAGTLGLRPMTPIRDAFQLFLTTYPMLGGKYLMKGLAKSFEARKGLSESSPWKIAEQYGALMTHSDLRNLYTSGNESLATGAVSKFSEKMLLPLQFSNNSNRLVSFWGHAEKALDAMKMHRSDPAKLAKESGLIYMDKTQQQFYLQQIAKATDPSQMQDIAFKIGKELTDLSQWNYRRGAHPGTYKYALGRLLGQYGTWPMNYIEYLRRIGRSGDASDKAGTLARWAAIHYTVLKAGEALGVDTGTWVFTNPAAYAGSPVFNAATSLPQAIGDTQTGFGTEARRNVEKLPQIAIPGGLAASRWYDIVTSGDSSNPYLELLGFNAMDDSDMKKGLHNLP
jgi:hypothetical protein